MASSVRPPVFMELDCQLLREDVPETVGISTTVVIFDPEQGWVPFLDPSAAFYNAAKIPEEQAIRMMISITKTLKQIELDPVRARARLHAVPIAA